jgi:hypothetical protein
VIDAVHDEYLHGCDDEFVTGPAHPDAIIAALMRDPCSSVSRRTGG